MSIAVFNHPAPSLLSVNKRGAKGDAILFLLNYALKIENLGFNDFMTRHNAVNVICHKPRTSIVASI